jgi:dCTP deaminase
MPATGSLPLQLIEQLIDAGYIRGAYKGHIQPSSLDLTLTDACYAMPGSLLPRPGESIESIIASHNGTPHSLDKPLEVGRVYLVRLSEFVAFSPDLSATASNKSSSGRINLRGRLLADGVASFDELPRGYHGQLWIELIPMSFPVRVHAGERINQLRIFAGDGRLSRIEHELLYATEPLLRTQQGCGIPASSLHVGKAITMTVDLSTHEIVGWKAKQQTAVFMDTKVFDHPKEHFFEPVLRPSDGQILLKPGDFFILGTKEKIVIPPTYAAEMIAYDGTKGEFRSHFAGFFDPGFGWHEDAAQRGTIAVLEVEAYGNPFFLRDEQPVCLMAYEHLVASPSKLYGSELKSNYGQQQGPRLAKWFV